VDHRPVNDREIVVFRCRGFSAWLLGMLAGTLVVPAAGQNLDAGKSPAQIFSEVCANCHRSSRDFRGGVSTSFLREHYTTSSDMASTMAAYLSGARSDPRAGQPPAARSPAAASAGNGRDSPTDTTRDARRPQIGDAKPGEGKPADPKSSASAPIGFSRTRPGSARAEAAAKPGPAIEAKPPAAAAPPPPPLEEFEE
jgi:hypothetical protein